MSNIATYDNEINQRILQGKQMDAFEAHYGDDVVMQENTQEPTVGKDANRTKQQSFGQNVKGVEGSDLVHTAINGDISFSQWSFRFIFANDERHTLNQVAVRSWKDDKVVHERFFYQMG